jgi:hypothetical protein
VWVLESLVDDGDEVVCVGVVENPVRSGDRNYQEDAKRLLQTIQDKNTTNRAIIIVLKYSVGKLHSTFQQLVGLFLRRSDCHHGWGRQDGDIYPHHSRVLVANLSYHLVKTKQRQTIYWGCCRHHS